MGGSFLYFSVDKHILVHRFYQTGRGYRWRSSTVVSVVSRLDSECLQGWPTGGTPSARPYVSRGRAPGISHSQLQEWLCAASCRVGAHCYVTSSKYLAFPPLNSPSQPTTKDYLYKYLYVHSFCYYPPSFLFLTNYTTLIYCWPGRISATLPWDRSL